MSLLKRVRCALDPVTFSRRAGKWKVGMFALAVPFIFWIMSACFVNFVSADDTPGKDVKTEKKAAVKAEVTKEKVKKEKVEKEKVEKGKGSTIDALRNNFKSEDAFKLYVLARKMQGQAKELFEMAKQLEFEARSKDKKK